MTKNEVAPFCPGHGKARVSPLTTFCHSKSSKTAVNCTHQYDSGNFSNRRAWHQIQIDLFRETAWPLLIPILTNYRFFSAQCSMCIARYCYRHRPSVCLSVLTLMYRGHISWVSSQVSTRLISFGSSLLRAERRQSSPRGTPLKFGWNRGRVAVLDRKPAISLKWGKIGPRLILLMTNRKLHTRFRLVPKSMNFDDLERPLRIPLHKTCVFRSPPRKFE